MTRQSWLVCEGMTELCLVVTTPPHPDLFTGRGMAIDQFATEMREYGFPTQRWTIDAERCEAMDGLEPTNYTLLALGITKKLSSGCGNCGRTIYADTDDEGKRMIYAMTDDGQAGVDAIKDEATGKLFCTDTCHATWRTNEPHDADVPIPVHDLADDLYPRLEFVRERQLAERSVRSG